MTGLAPISNEAAVSANSAVAANSGATSAAQSADVRRPADFSSVLNATSNAAQTTPAETPSKNVVVAQGNSSRGQKTSTRQENQQAAVAGYACRVCQLWCPFKFCRRLRPALQRQFLRRRSTSNDRTFKFSGGRIRIFCCGECAKCRASYCGFRRAGATGESGGRAREQNRERRATHRDSCARMI